jgi:hypothetical protein
MSLLHTSAHWFVQNPLVAAIALYIARVISDVYTYFELRDQQ